MLESLCFCDLIACFFKAYKPEGENQYVMDLPKVAWNNLTSDTFLFDLITLIPWGLLMHTVEHEANIKLLRLLWLIKLLRIKKMYALLDRSKLAGLVH